jgi:hypothetical protein
MDVANVLELVGRMRRAELSRNQSFDTFVDADGMRARRIWRYLRSLEADLRELGARTGLGVVIRVEPRPEGGKRITIEVPEVRIRRIGVVSAEEYELLRQHPDVRAVLDVAEGRRQ